jgi:hypothetical protein
MPSELREALTAAGASALVPKIIDPILVEYQRRYAPLCRAIPTQQWDTDQYYFNQRTSVASGGAVPDGGAKPVSSSTYVQNNFQMKHVESVGAVTGYAQEVTRQVVGDLRTTEIQGSIRGYYWDIETFACWGNSASTLNQAQPQFDGLDTLINVFSGGTQNVIDKAGNTLTLATLDELIDMVESNAAMPVADDSWMFITSSTGQSKIAQLLVNQQRFNDKVEVAAGLIVPTYRNIPLLKSTFMSMRGYSVGTVTAATATTGGSLPASSTYKYQVSAVVARQGEIAPSVEVSQATGSGTSTNTITLSFTAPTGLDGLSPQLYKVWRTAAGGASGSETFLGYVDSTVGLASDGVTPVLTNQIVDTGTALVPQQSSGSVVPATLPTTYFGTNSAMLPPSLGQENIYLISRDRGNVVRPYVREAQPLDVFPTTSSPDTLPYCVIGDTTLAVRAEKFLGRAYRVGVSV